MKRSGAESRSPRKRASRNVDSPAFPERIDQYELLDCLGRGGMGIVYRARHSATGRMVALKTIQSLTPRAIDSLRREIVLLAALKHPGIISIYDHGLEGHCPWYVMEYIRGESLRARYSCQESSQDWWTRSLESTGRTDDLFGRPVIQCDICRPEDRRVIEDGYLAEVITLIRRLCSPLALMHGEGLVHRDIKPDNILLRSNHYPVIMDFGLASFFGARAYRESSSNTGDRTGTLVYMAPEQLRNGFVDARADLYSLGCVMYELLTRRRPYEAHSGSELLRAQSEARCRPVSYWVDGVPSNVDSLISNLLEIDPTNRIGYAMDLEKILEDLGAGAGFEIQTPPRVYLHRASFKGRSSISRTLDTHLAVATASRGKSIFLGGESGIGKTRLMLQVARYARSNGFEVLFGECMPLDIQRSSDSTTTSQPFNAFRKPLRKIADICNAGDPEDIRSILGNGPLNLAMYEASLGPLTGAGSPVLSELRHSPRNLQRRLFEEFRTILENICRRTPLLIVLDDIHWADLMSISFINHLLETGFFERNRAVMIGTYRVEELTPAIERFQQMSAAQTIILERLPLPDISAIIQDMLAFPRVPEEFVRRINDVSGGNPFFVAEYLHACVDAGILTKSSHGIWTLADQPLTHEAMLTEHWPQCPESLQNLLAHRLALLPESLSRIVQTAAVLGSEFRLDMLNRLMDLDPQDMTLRIQELKNRRIVEDLPSGEYRFYHGKIQETAYQSIPATLNIELHRRTAEMIERHFPEYADSNPVTLGRHWEISGYFEAAGSYYFKAANHYYDRYIFDEVERLLKKVLELLPEPSQLKIKARNTLAGRLYNYLCRLEESIEQSKLAVQESKALNSDPDLAEAYVGMSCAYFAMGKHAEGESHSHKALELFERLGNHQRVCLLKGNLAVSAQRQGRFKEAKALLGDVIPQLMEMGDIPRVCNFRMNHAIVNFILGHVDESFDEFSRTLELCREHKLRHTEGNVMEQMGIGYAHVGQIDTAKSWFEEAIAIHRETGNRKQEVAALINMTSLLRYSISNDDQVNMLRRALKLNEDLDDKRATVAALILLTNVFLRTGQLDTVEDEIRAARDLAERIQTHDLVAEADGTLARYYSLIGDYNQAKICNSRKIEFWKKTGSLRGELQGLVQDIVFDLKMGRTSDHTELLDKALEFATRHNDVNLMRITLETKSEIARLAGDLDAYREINEKLLGIFSDPHSFEHNMFMEKKIRIHRWLGEDPGELLRKLDPVEQFFCENHYLFAQIQSVCARGFLLLAHGQSGWDCARKANRLLSNLNINRNAEILLEIHRLESACRCFDDGIPLVAGECPDDLSS